MPTKTRELRFVAQPEGLPGPEHFAVHELELPDPQDGQVLVQNLIMSVDPAMRPALARGQTPLGSTPRGAAIGRVLASGNSSYAPGDYVQNMRAFCEHFISDGRGLQRVDPRQGSLSARLGVLGGTGLTAYAGLLKVGELKDGETVFVSAAAGAVGSIALQIAKIKGCTAIGSCGSDAKVAFLRDELHADHAFNYKTSDIRAELRKGAPQGIDVYFENVGGAHLDAALTCMRPLGRIPVCGMISAYNSKGARSEGVTTLSNMIYNRITMRGFTVYEYLDLMPQFLADMNAWLAAGKLTHRETFFDGLENAPAALAGLFTGENIGKMLVRLAPDPLS
jgi:NADPH-dependent curcumin reductase CurA